jgi:choline-sulfatase
MVRRDRFKYVYYHGEEPQLFDLRADPDEHHNLADDPEYSEICEQMRGLALEDWAPEEVAQDYERRMQDIRYVTRWGREVGLGALDLWDQASYGSPNG